MQTKSYLNFNAKSHSNLLAIFSLKSDFTSNFQTLLDSKEIKVFENQRKSLIQHFEQSELRLHFDWTKVDRKCQNQPILDSQTVFPDRSILNWSKNGGNYCN